MRLCGREYFKHQDGRTADMSCDSQHAFAQKDVRECEDDVCLETSSGDALDRSDMVFII